MPELAPWHWYWALSSLSTRGSGAEPGSVHDVTAARQHMLGALYWAASQLDLPTLADGGYDGSGIEPFRVTCGGLV
jgi:hypothetical protein